jgi:hypothetical protein
MRAKSDITTVTNLQKLWAVRVVGAIGALALLSVAAPFIWSAVSAGIGLAAMAAIGIAGVAVFQSIPLGMQKLENHILALRKAEARRNPIEQLQNELIRRANKLRAFHRALVTVGGQIESIAHMLEDRKHKDPAHVLHRQERALTRLQEFHGINLQRLNAAQVALDEFRFTIERKESEWRIALAIGEATDMLDPNATDNLMQDLLTDTALRSVQERFNTVFAELDVQMTSAGGPTRSLLQREELSPLGSLELSGIAHQGDRS